MEYDTLENSENKIKLDDGKLFDVIMEKDVVQQIVPHRIKYSKFKRIFESSSSKNSTIRASEITIQYTPILDGVGGSIILNLYDLRHKNPRMKLLLHTSFSAGSGQFVNLCPNTVFFLNKMKDDIVLEVIEKDVEVEHGVAFGKIKARCSFIKHEKTTTGDTPMMAGVPGLLYTRGDLLHADQIEKLTRQYGFLGPPLVRGMNYVLEGIGANCRVIKSAQLTTAPGDTHTRRNIYEEEENPIV